MDRLMDQWTKGLMDGWMDRWTNRPTNKAGCRVAQYVTKNATELYRIGGVGQPLESSKSKLFAEKLIHRRMDRLTDDSLQTKCGTATKLRNET